MVKETDILRYLSQRYKVVGECWLWKLSKNKGYGNAWWNGKTVLAHRLCKQALHGPPSDPKLYACHTCDVKSCINPDHLYWGTNSQNQQDSIRRGTNSMMTRTHCKVGHEFTKENSMTISAGEKSYRTCRKCFLSKSRVVKKRYFLKNPDRVRALRRANALKNRELRKVRK